jgi:phosphatidate cytidylyltransferase
VISNPLTDPLFPPTARVVLAVLVLGLALLLIAQRGDLRGLRSSVLFTRWSVWAMIAPIYALAVLSGPLPTLLLVGAIVLQAIREYVRLVDLPRLYGWVLLGLGLAQGILALAGPGPFFAVLPLLLIAATLQPLLTQDVRAGVTHLAFAALGFAYLPLLLWHLLLIQVAIPGGGGLLLALGLAVALSDIGAFTVGRLLGRHRLSPLISPNKSWEGVLGNLLGAALGFALLSFALPAQIPPWLAAALPLVVAVGAVWGDLVESLLKRQFAVKDAGAWLPGFGGLLDRVDSLIVVAPLVYHLVRAFG